jgi:hypothetical protein
MCRSRGVRFLNHLNPVQHWLPDLYALLRREVARLAGCTSKAAYHASWLRTVLGAELPGLRAVVDAVAYARLARLRAPGLREAEEEALVGREASSVTSGLPCCESL